MDICPVALLELLTTDLCADLDASSAELVLTDDVCFTKHTEPHIVARHALRRSLLKKFQGSRQDRKAADERAQALFLTWNKRCEEWSPPKPQDDLVSLAIGEFRQAFLQCFETPDGGVLDFSQSVDQFFDVGPGAAVGAHLTDLYSKLYAGDLSVTSEDLYWDYYSRTLPFELESRAEETRSATYSTPLVEGSTLGFAPKNSDISRTRCTEPSLNMVYQLGTGTILEGLLKKFFNIDLSDQPDLNRELSRRGSISGMFGTTDQSSASDATSLGLWNWLMAYPEVRNWFLWIRSNSTKLPDGNRVRLHMLSSMGNGFTFPLMTLIYACVVKGCYRALGIPIRYNKHAGTVSRPSGSSETGVVTRAIKEPGNFGVFGDDIIVVTEAFELVNKVLVALGYAVNQDKSFGSGPFRESCGTDWFVGHNVRGVYCRRLSSPQRVYSLINRLNKWSAEWFIPLTKTIGLLKSKVWYLTVPPWESESSGIIVPYHLHKFKKLVGGLIPYKGMRPRITSWTPELGVHTRSSVVKRPDPRADFVNEFGVIIGYVRGCIKRGLVTVRPPGGDELDTKFHKTTLQTPGWGRDEWLQGGFTPAGWANFESCIAQLNLA